MTALLPLMNFLTLKNISNNCVAAAWACFAPINENAYLEISGKAAAKNTISKMISRHTHPLIIIIFLCF